LQCGCEVVVADVQASVSSLGYRRRCARLNMTSVPTEQPLPLCRRPAGRNEQAAPTVRSLLDRRRCGFVEHSGCLERRGLAIRFARAGDGYR